MTRRNREHFLVMDLHEANQRKLDEYTPAVCVFSVVTVFGILGNALSVVYHGFIVPKTTVNFLITALGSVDLLACLAIIGNIVELFYAVTFTSALGCKILAFSNHWLVTSSGLAVVVVTIDRYRRVCKPFNWQFSMMTAQRTFVAMVGFAFLLSVRDVIVFDVISINATRGDNVSVLGCHCSHSANKVMQPVISIFHLIDLILYVILIVLTTVAYFLVVRALLKSRKRIAKHLKKTDPADKSKICGNELDLEGRGYKTNDLIATMTEKSSESEAEDIENVTRGPAVNCRGASENGRDRQQEDTRKVGSMGKEQEICKGTSIAVNVKQENASPDKTKSAEINHCHLKINDKKNIDIMRDNLIEKIKDEEIDDKKDGKKKDSSRDTLCACKNDETKGTECYECSFRTLNTDSSRTNDAVEICRAKSTRLTSQPVTRQEVQITVMMIAIAFISFTSFIPYFVVKLLVKHDSNDIDTQFFSPGIQIAVRSYKLHSAINPYIICFFQTKFRNFIKNLFVKSAKKIILRE